MLWPITSNPNPRVLKIEKWKINWKENKMRKKMKKKLSPYSLILILCYITLPFVTLCDICNHYASLSKSTIKDRKENQKKLKKREK